eukprot:TRINITY_DN16560_c0_g1_i2.p1 TRINITY_DN16560_c0_g1~~TRINITY_DN16560_c0_g1_i2.p1  ORF type:complete len:182 (-),score=30.25 TRINITY_DN16560_c0_g1_i2:60-605(-)
MDDYVNDKKNIHKFQDKSGVLFLNKDRRDKYHKEFKDEANGSVIYFSADDVKSYETKLLGIHNLENIAVARALCIELGIDEKVIKEVVEKFEAPEFRLEKIGEINGISFINDSTCTTPIAGEKALDSFNNKVLLICGGATKGLQMDDFAKKIVESQNGQYYQMAQKRKVQKIKQKVLVVKI